MNTPTTTATTNKRAMTTRTAILIVSVGVIATLVAGFSWVGYRGRLARRAIASNYHCEMAMNMAVAMLDRTQSADKEEMRRIHVGGVVVDGMYHALTLYRAQIGAYPTTDEGLRALVYRPSNDEVREHWAGPYFSDPDFLIDPWGNAYQYACPAERGDRGYDLWSMGPDGVDNTDDDIGNWMIPRSN